MTINRLQIDFLYLDLETCTRCRGTDRNLESALEAASKSLSAAGPAVEGNKVHVTSVEQARELRFESSPTIRVNGRDVALELRESSCGEEACTDGCGEGIACRVWLHEGREHTEPPVEMILEAIEREAAFELPPNLERFFAGKEAAAAHDEPAGECCPPAEAATCCEPSEKTECCGASPAGSCGCR
jgi:hypothetical protein